MDRAGVRLDEDDDDESDEPIRDGAPISEERLGVFRDFINTLDLDDFEKKGN